MDLVTTWKLTAVLHCYTSQIRAVVSGTVRSQCRINLCYTAHQPHFNYFSSLLLYMGPLGMMKILFVGCFPPPPQVHLQVLGNTIPDVPHRWGTPHFRGNLPVQHCDPHLFLGIRMTIWVPVLIRVWVTRRLDQGITKGRTHMVGQHPKAPSPGTSQQLQLPVLQMSLAQPWNCNHNDKAKHSLSRIQN